MNSFQYKAVQRSGEIIEGEIEAADREGAFDKLSDLGYVPIRVDETGRSFLKTLLSTDLSPSRSRRISSRDIMILTREIATLLDAGVELERALEITVDVSGKPAVRNLFQEILEEVRGGSSLSEALEKRSEMFPPSYISIVRAGEAGGALAVVFERLARYLESTQAARENLRSALIYPVLLMIMAILSVIIMVMVVLPQFEQLFANSGQELPLLTQIVLAMSDAVVSYGLIALALIPLSVFLFRHWSRNPATRLKLHRWFLHVPLAGSLILKSDVARFARTLSTLLQNGVSTLAALDIVGGTLTNAFLADQLRQAAERIKSGSTMSEALVSMSRFPDLATHLIRVGEESGRIEAMLERLALIYEDETQRSVQRLLAMLLPGLTIFIGLFIAAIIGSIFLAIVSVNQLVF